MTILNKAVNDLADALETLDAKVTQKVREDEARSLRLTAAARETASARAVVDNAAQAVDDAIAAIDALIEDAGGDKPQTETSNGAS